MIKINKIIYLYLFILVFLTSNSYSCLNIINNYSFLIIDTFNSGKYDYLNKFFPHYIYNNFNYYGIYFNFAFKKIFNKNEYNDQNIKLFLVCNKQKTEILSISIVKINEKTGDFLITYIEKNNNYPTFPFYKKLFFKTPSHLNILNIIRACNMHNYNKNDEYSIKLIAMDKRLEEYYKKFGFEYDLKSNERKNMILIMNNKK